MIELWDLFKRLGMERPPKFVQYYERVTRADVVKLAWWDRDEKGTGEGFNVNAILPIQPAPVTGMQAWFDTVCTIRKV